MNPSKLAVALAASLFLVTASAQDKGGPSDPQIAGIVVAANQIDVDAGKLAKSHTKNKEVSKFAQLMITDHTAVNKQAEAPAKKAGDKPRERTTSPSLKTRAAETTQHLQRLGGAGCEKTYHPP